MLYSTVVILTATLLAGCTGNTLNVAQPEQTAATAPSYDTSLRTVHVYVALCDNRYQGIVPVPAAIGNGQDPDRNLYWGAGYGVRTYFSRSKEWTLAAKLPADSVRLERLLFKHRNGKWWMLAEAYDGRAIRSCTENFLASCAGRGAGIETAGNVRIGTGGAAAVVAYVGHDGLMDFSLDASPTAADAEPRDAIILACSSKPYFSSALQRTGAAPLLWTTNLMCPEAYTLHDALSAHISGGDAAKVRAAAAAAYAKFQKCSAAAAGRLLVTGH